MPGTEELLMLLAASDERSLREALSLRPTPQAAKPGALDRATRRLVELAALIATDAETASLRWAAERASATGAGDEALARVLVSAGAAFGTAQTATSAPRLALALDLDVEVESGARSEA